MSPSDASPLERLRAALQDLEQQWATTSTPLPGAVPWLALDAQGRVVEVTAAAAAALGLDDRAVGHRLQELLEMTGDPMRGGLLRARVGGSERVLFSLLQAEAACVVVASGDPGEAMDRKLVHDLANVLAVVRGRAEMAAMDDIPDAVRASMAEIIVAVDRARALLGD